MFFYYSINGVLSSPNGLLLYFQQRALIWFLLIILLSNVNTIRLEYSLQKERTGPYTESVQTDFAVINNLCQPNETVAFSKPFLINLFCDRNSYYLTNTNYPRIIKQATYLLLPKKEIGDLYASTNTIKLIKGDTIPLTHFYLVKL